MSMAMSWSAELGARSARRGMPPGMAAFPPRRQHSEFTRSMRLLSNTNQRISLFRLSFTGLAPDVVDAVTADLFDDQGLIYRLADGTFLLLVVRFDFDDRAATDRIAAALDEALEHYDPAPEAAVTVTALHRHAALFGDCEDLLAELTCGEPLVLRCAA